MPPPMVPSTGLPLNILVTVGRSHTDPIAETNPKVPRSVLMDSSVGFSATSSGTPIRSWCWSSAGSNRCALAWVSFSHAG